MFTLFVVFCMMYDGQAQCHERPIMNFGNETSCADYLGTSFKIGGNASYAYCRSVPLQQKKK